MWPFGLVGGAGDSEAWTPLDAEGSLVLYMDAEQGVVQSGGVVSQWQSLVGGWTFSQATEALRPTVSTLNGKVAIYSDGTQFLTKDQDSLIIEPDQKFLLGVIYSQDTLVTQFDGIWGDGTTSDSVIKFGKSDHDSYQKFFFGCHDNRFTPVSVDNPTDAVAGDEEAVLLTYNGVDNDYTGWTAKVNNVTKLVGTVGGFGSATEKGGLFNYQGSPYILNGKIRRLFIIVDYTAADEAGAIELLSDGGTYY